MVASSTTTSTTTAASTPQRTILTRLDSAPHFSFSFPKNPFTFSCTFIPTGC